MALISEALLGVIVGVILGFLSTFVMNRIEAHIKRPILSISEETTTVAISIYQKYTTNHLDERSSAESAFRYWIATRAKVENQGRTAAENCKISLFFSPFSKYRGVLPVGESRVRWMIPKDDLTVTINANDSELIDLCAFHLKLGLVFTTERGYGEEPYGRTVMSPGNVIEGQLKVSASNAKRCVKDIWIYYPRDREEAERMVYFSKPKEKWVRDPNLPDQTNSAGDR